MVFKDQKDIIFASEQYFSLFDYHWLAGSPKIALNDTYATPEVRAAWDAAHGEVKLVQPPPGDFAFEPVTEQAERTPIPIYVEFPEGSPA